METCAEAPEAAAATECEVVVEGSSAAAADSPAPVENNALTSDYTPDGKDPSTVDTETSADSSGMKVVLGAATGAHLLPAGAADEMDGVTADALADAAARADGEEALVLDAAPPREELNRNESVASSASDTPSSADSVYESEAHRRRREQLDLDAEALEAGPEPDHEPEVVVPQPDHEPEVVDPQPDPEPEVVDPQPDPEPEVVEPEPDREPEVVEPELDREPEVVEPELDREPEVDTHPDCCSVDRPHGRCHHELEADPHRPDSEPDIDCEFDVQPEAADHDRDLDVETGEDPEDHEIPFEPALTETAEELILEQYFRQESMSDFSNESCHDELDPDEMDECLQRVEIAAASSDSEANENEKWRSIFSSSINKEDDDSYLDSLQLSAQELFVQKVEVMDSNQGDGDTVQIVELPPEEEEVLEQPDDILSFPSPPQEVTYNPLTLQVLSRISEDGGENGKDGSGGDEQHQRLLASDPGGKKLPKDFCVIQETMSENVSTEHVDFQLARKQWREMEEQTKNRVVCPATRQPIMHGSHSFMYTPVRNVERPHRKAHELESLTLLGDYSHTLFSPCSEDSGLDDSSYRSPYDDPETPIEKEIRMAMEREEDFRRERGRSIPRSTSTPLTPSFIITSSPAKVPLSHAATANNIIIQEPADDQSLRDSSVDAVPAGTNANVIILETSHLIIRSSSDYCLNKACEQPQEKIFLSNPFFKLRSRSTLSLVDEEIQMARQREEELRRERACRYTKDRFNTPSPDHMDALAFHNPDDVPVKCKSSPSSPMKTAYKMDRSTLSCEHRFPEVYTGGRRKSALALRWEAGEFAAGGD